MKVVLVHPLIPGNTGTIGRTCVALNLELIVIHPIGFDLSEKAVRRAGLDYWAHVALSEYESWSDFLRARAPRPDQMYLFEQDGAGGSIYGATFASDAYLVFGQETKGLSPQIRAGREAQTYYLPMCSAHIRSLNLANAVTAVAYQALSAYLS